MTGKIIFCLLSLMCAVTCVSLSATAAEAPVEKTPAEIHIGFIPAGDREALRKGAFTMAKALQETLHIPISIYIPKSYSTLVDEIKEKKVDFAFLSAASYVAVEKEASVQVLLKQIWQEPYYFSIVVALKNSSIQRLTDLKGKTIAFVDRKSASGYLYPQVMLRKAGFTDGTFKEIKFSGSHANSVAMLKSGEVDAIAIFSDDKAGKQSAWQKFGKSGDQDIRVLWNSQPIPNDPFCVRQDFYEQYPKVVHSLMFALIDVAEKLKDHPEVKGFLGSRGFLPATRRQYDPVREMVRELGAEATSP